MGLSSVQSQRVEDILRSGLRHKLDNYQPEPNSMPFHTRLLGTDRLALFSFIHSLNTNFGTSIFEPIAVELAKSRFKSASSQVIAGKKMSSDSQIEIQRIMDKLATAESEPNKFEEIEKIRHVCQSGHMASVKPTKVDLMIEDYSGSFYLFDLKTAKPNAGDFKEFKRTLLEWVATRLADNPKCVIYTGIAIPYNPYAPKPYNRWTMRGMLDLKHELMVAEEFWNFLGGDGVYEDLLDTFEKVGLELRPEIDAAFARFR